MKSFLTLSWSTIRTVFAALLGTNARRAITTLVVSIASALGTQIDPEWFSGILALAAAVFGGLAVRDQKRKSDEPISSDMNFDQRQDGGMP